MKKILHRFLPLLLVFALMIPLAGTAWAKDASGIKLNKTAEQTLYYRSGGEAGSRADSVTITATVTPEDYDGKITWTVSNPSAITTNLSLGKALDNTAANRSIRVTAAEVSAATTVSLTATVTGTAAVSVPIRVVPDSVQSFRLVLEKSSIMPGEKIAAAASPKYASGDAASVTYSTSDPTIAEINALTGVITGKKIGTATIYAVASGGVTASAVLTVSSAVSFRYEGTKGASVGKNFSLSAVQYDLLRNFRDTDFDEDDEVTFSGLRDSAYGALYFNGAELGNKDTVTFGELSRVSFVAERDRDYEFSVSVRHGSVSYTADVLIGCSLAEINVYIPIGGDENYKFTDKSAGGKTAEQLIRDAFSNFSDFARGSFEFERPDRASKKIGTLTTTDDKNEDYVDIVNTADLSKLYFIPEYDTGIYHADYTFYSEADGKGLKIAAGTLNISLNAASLDVTVKINNDDPFTFTTTQGIKGRTSTKDLLIDAIDSVLGEGTWGGVYFNTDKTSRDSDYVGTLYRDNSSTKSTNALESDDYIARSALGQLYFYPEEIGTYEVRFDVYETSGASAVLASGTLSIHVANDMDSMDFQYATMVGETVELNEDDFANVIIEHFGSRFELAYITLDGYSGDGTFDDGDGKIIPGRSSVKYYAEDYSDAPRKAENIRDLSFTAPRKPGTTIVKFTAYGDRNGTLEAASGVFCIFYGAADVPAITLDYYTSSRLIGVAALTEDLFTEVYSTAMESTEKKPQFTVRFLTIPESGVLYKNYVSERNNGTKLSSSNIKTQEFTVGASRTTDSISTVSYVGLVMDDAAADEATYLVLDSSGNPLYTGTINFICVKPRAVTVSSEGLDFTAADFNRTSDPITYVTFSQPESGKMYMTVNSRLIPVTEAMKFWISDAKYGDHPVSAAHFIPRAGSTDPVTLTYTAHTRSGGAYTYRILVTPTSKIISDQFTDVKGNTGTWAANSVDFASRYGLVQGVGSGKFNPEATMYRCDLMLLFYRMAGSPAVTGTMPFKDVAAGTDSYSTEIYNSVLWANQNGILEGVVTGKEYQGKTRVTRQEYIRFLYNYTKALGLSVANNGTLDGFVDASEIADYAVDAIKWALANGYVLGMDATHVAPKNETRRAEIVTLLHRYFTY